LFDAIVNQSLPSASSSRVRFSVDTRADLQPLSLSNCSPGPDELRPPLTELECDALAARITRESHGEPIWVFAYGSLIWKPEFAAVESIKGLAYGWHRSFCLRLHRWRGSPQQPGLMMALDHGGVCAGMLYRLNDQERVAQIRRLIKREIGTLDDAKTIRWLTVHTNEGPRRALVFWAGPKGERVSLKLPLKSVARVVARACGHGGSCAEYLYLTVKHLHQHGIRDRNLWKLQELVAEEIRGLRHARLAL
jgi:cation transport protein ChaC